MDYKIKENPMYHTKGQSYYCVLRNDRHSEVIWGSSPEVVKNKIKRQLKKWEADDGKINGP